MPINLLHEQPLNSYIYDVVFHGTKPVMEFTNNAKGEFQSPEYVMQNKDSIVRAIMYQYFKRRLRQYFVDKNDAPYIVPVDETRRDLPGWVVPVFERNEQVYEFDASRITPELQQNISDLRDFMYSVAEVYVDKRIAMAKDSRQNPTIRFDYLKTNNEYDTIDRALAVAAQWHGKMSLNAEKFAHNKELYQKSLMGTKHVMDLTDGVAVYQLLTPDALDFESEYMGHCVGRGEYDKGVADGTTQIYSIRDENGEPHVTFEVRGGMVCQCKGKANKRPIAKYRPLIKKFIETMQFDIAAADAKNIGLIRQDGKYYDLFNLPAGFVVKGNVDLSLMGLTELPDFSTVVVNGNFSCGGNQLTNLKGAPKKVGGDLWCVKSQLTSLDGAPRYVGGSVWCGSNQLVNLKGGPEKVGGDFRCDGNFLTSLVGAPREVLGSFECPDNELVDLKGAPETVGGSFACEGNPITSFADAPKKIGGVFYCSDDYLTDTQNIPALFAAGTKIIGISEEILESWRERLQQTKSKRFVSGTRKIKTTKTKKVINNKGEIDVR